MKSYFKYDFNVCNKYQLDVYERLIYSTLCGFQNFDSNKGNVFTVTIDKLSSINMISKDKTIDSIKRLVGIGLVNVEVRGKRNYYYIPTPEANGEDNSMTISTTTNPQSNSIGGEEKDCGQREEETPNVESSIVELQNMILGEESTKEEKVSQIEEKGPQNESDINTCAAVGDKYAYLDEIDIENYNKWFSDEGTTTPYEYIQSRYNDIDEFLSGDDIVTLLKYNYGNKFKLSEYYYYITQQSLSISS